MRSVAAVVALVACLHAAVWALLQRQSVAPEYDQPLASVSYQPFEGISDPNDPASRPTAAQIRADLAAIAPYTQTIRLYKSTGGLEMVPPIAAEFGLKVTLGIWLDTNLDRNGKFDDRNEREIRSAIELAKHYSNVNAIVVGNETTLRGSLFEASIAAEANKSGRPFAAVKAERLAALQAEAQKSGRSVADLKSEQNIDDLIKIIQRVKRQVSVPVTTGETWDVWRDYPKLATAVDFIGAHILPYWDRKPYNQAVDFTLDTYYNLRNEFPGKRIVIAEFGWPSGGYNRSGADPGRVEQATVLRQFVNRADALGIDYNVIEAFDQPWKNFEGSVGQYWGLFDANREAKFSWTGPIADPDHWKLAAVAVAVGFLISLPILSIAGATAGQALLLAASAHAVGAWAATVFQYWNGHYFVFGAAFALALGLVLLVPLVLIAMARIDEIATIVLGRGPARLLRPLAPVDGYAPKVSIHIPACMEPPEMLKATLNSVAALDYPNFECVLVINNTPDPLYWRPIEDHCRELGERFRFVNVEKLEGYKAGALRVALAHTAADAEIIGVIDADYVVDPNWLKHVVPAFADAKVGLAQAPQDHRDEAKSPLHRAMNSEYAGFFDIGMIQRNENNAIIVHGTMCLIRRTAIEAAGGWSSDTICEDTDLGLSILELGWEAHYTNRRYGRGLLPDSFESYKKQRHRWAYGGLQIVRKHWRRFLPGATRLSSEQKREFLLGWLNWLGAESIGVAVAILNLIWVPVVAFVGIAIPDKVLTLPIIAAFTVSLAHFVTLYRRRVALPASHAVIGMFAAMALQWTVARAVGFGLIKDRLPFVRTAKGGASRRRLAFPAFYETVMGALLVLGAAVVFATNHERVREIDLFGCVLLVQSLPFLSATLLAVFETSRLNDFAYLAQLRARATELVGRRPAITQASVPVENRVEAAQ